MEDAIARFTRAAGQITLGLVLGLVAAESLAWIRDGGAFPHINVLVEDAQLGVRMRPGARERIKLGDNPIAPFSLNDRGYRGEDWGPPGEDEIIVIGDSQVFGLGVDDDETTPARLSAHAGVPVRNYGVPTYGPHEYLLILEEGLRERSPAFAVIVLNYANDLFELGLPNTTRHRVWDGWAVRIENAPESVTPFPGRRWLMSQSHAVYALRRWSDRGAQPQAAGLPSEGDWSTVLAHTLSATEGGSAPAAVDDASIVARINDNVAARKDTRKEQITIARQFSVLEEDDALAMLAVEREARPGDIVRNHLIEEARPVSVTAEMLRRGALLRHQMPEHIAAWLKEHPDSYGADRMRKLLARDEALREEMDQLSHQVAAELAATSPFASFLADARALTEAHSAELVVVGLPLDVQVDPEEFRKYDQEPVDMSDTVILIDDMVSTAERLGIRALSAVSPLRDAQPGAFLDGDIHLTPRGHDALAAAIAAELGLSRPYAQPGRDLIEGRSRVPLPAEWASVEENTVRGSSRNACVTKQIREWQRVSCRRPGHGRWTPLSATIVDAPTETMVTAGSGQVDIIAPLLPGRDVLVDVTWTDRTERLALRWEGDALDRAFTDAPAPQQPAPDADDGALQACMASLSLPPEARFGEARRGCAERYPSDCDAMVACAQGTRTHALRCPDGQASTGAAGHCLPLCDTARPCAVGVCTDWGGGGVCL